MHSEQLRFFKLLYQIRNASAAARLIPMSPQGLMKSIRSLETELGVPLFIIDKNGTMTPTAYSEAFNRFVQKTDADFRFFKCELERIAAQERCEIRLGTSLGIIGFIGADFLESFEKKHPSVSVTYNELSDVMCEAGLLSGAYDLAFTLAPYDGRVVTTDLYETQVYFWVNTEMAYGFGNSISISDLSGKSIAMPGKDYKIYNTIIERCLAESVNPKSVFTSSEIFWLYEFVSSRRGIAFTLPHLMALPTFTHNSSIRALPLEGVHWRFGIAHLSSHKLMPYERQFMEYCMAEFENTPASKWC